MKEKLIKMTIDLAQPTPDGAIDGGTIILVPDMSWFSSSEWFRLRDRWGRMREGFNRVFLRATTIHSALKSVRVDTLIMVAPGSSTWDGTGEELARNCLSISTRPRVIEVGRKP